MKLFPGFTTVMLSCALQFITLARAQDKIRKGYDDTQWKRSNLNSGERSAPFAKVSVDHDSHSANLAKHTVYNDIRMTALRHFKSRYPAVSNERWQKINDGFLVTFTLKDVTHKAVYDKKGNWRNTEVRLDERILPTALKKQIKSQYYDCVIKYVQEISSRDKVIYYAQIKCGRQWKIVQIRDGKMVLQKEFSEDFRGSLPE